MIHYILEFILFWLVIGFISPLPFTIQMVLKKKGTILELIDFHYRFCYYGPLMFFIAWFLYKIATQNER